MTKTFTRFYKNEVEKYQGITPLHLLHTTDLTKFGHINPDARSKGFFRRHGKQRILARKGAKWNMPAAEYNGSIPFPNRARGACIYFGGFVE